MTDRLRFDRGVTLIGGGPVGDRDLQEALALAPAVVAADGGADRAMGAGLEPAAVIGDFDSISELALASIPPSRLHRVDDQVTTDFQKCLSRIVAPFVIACGFLGGRMDHGLAALNGLVRHEGYPVFLISEADVIFAAPPRLALDLPEGERLSLFPMGAARGRSQGLNWPLDGISFAPDGLVGTSNRTTGPVSLQIDGPMLVILPRHLLRSVLLQMT